LEILPFNLTRQRTVCQQIVELLLFLPIGNILLAGVVGASQHVAKPQVATDVHF
jgi:hypothetical protein